VGTGGWLAPPLFSGPIGGMPADSNASLMSATRLCRGDATASDAALWMDGLSRKNQKIRARIRSPISASIALRNQGGRTDSWSIVPSSVIGRPPSGVTNSWNGRVLGWPRQKRFSG
jgi:hypothetical protein